MDILKIKCKNKKIGIKGAQKKHGEKWIENGKTVYKKRNGKHTKQSYFEGRNTTECKIAVVMAVTSQGLLVTRLG